MLNLNNNIYRVNWGMKSMSILIIKFIKKLVSLQFEKKYEFNIFNIHFYQIFTHTLPPLLPFNNFDFFINTKINLFNNKSTPKSC